MPLRTGRGPRRRRRGVSLHVSATSVALLLPVLICSCDFLPSKKEAPGAKTGPAEATAADEGELVIPLELDRIAKKAGQTDPAPLRPAPRWTEMRDEIRVKIYWANNVRTRQWPFGQCIHSPTLALPPTVHQVPLSLDGAHIVIQLGKIECADFNDLARKLVELAMRRPDMSVVIDARQAVPFKWVFGAVEACEKAKVRSVKFQAPAVVDGGGDDWWHM